MKKRFVLVAFVGMLCNPFFSFAQDSIAVQDLNEEKELKFQQYFFKALSEKSIKNYQKAIENLEFCNELISNNAAVYFEFSKNYYFLEQYQLAKQFVQKALDIQNNNIWMLIHLANIHKKEGDYNSGISVLKKVVKRDPSKKGDLVRLYYLNRNHQEALQLLNEMEKEQGLSRNLLALKRTLAFSKVAVVEEKTEDLVSIVSKFEENNSFQLLKRLLEKASKEDVSVLHKYSEKALDLFPAQPYVYLMRGKSLQIQNKSQEALSILQSGIDFVIENPKMEAMFYELMAKVHDTLGNVSKAQEYRNLAKKINTVE